MNGKIILKNFHCLPLLVLVTFFSCEDRNERIINSGVFEMQLKSWSHFGKIEFQVVYNDLPNTPFERETLTIFKTYKREEQPYTDTLKVKINSEQEDSIYYYAYKYLSNFKISNKEEAINGERLIEVYDDGGNYSVSLEENEYRKLEATKYSTAGIKESSDEASKLVSFINRQVPENFRIY